jgi:regulator of chromosome condensation (RCC1) repeat-containing protein/ricin-type beta-trefoil lectin protein
VPSKAARPTAWGDNSVGELGNGTTVNSSVPVAVSTSGVLAGQTLTQISAGESYTCAVDAAGAATCTVTGLTGLAGGTLYEISVVAHTTAGDSGASTPVIAALKPAGAIVAGDDNAKCVDDMGDSAVDRTVIAMGDCDGSPEQDWAIGANGTIQINGKCMDIKRDSKLNGGTGRAVCLQWRRQPAVAAQIRHPGQSGVRQVPQRSGGHRHRRHPAEHLDLQHCLRPAMAAALTGARAALHR